MAPERPTGCWDGQSRASSATASACGCDRARLLRGRARGREGLSALHRPAPALRERRTATTSAWPTERSLERLGAERFDLLLLHNPDRTGYTSERVWEAMQACARSRASRVCWAWRPGPANGFTLDLIDCIERFGGLIDWAMIILSPMEPWPGELVLERGRQARREADHPRGGLRRRVPRRRAPGARFRAVRPPQVPSRRAGWRRGWRSSSGCAPTPSATGSRCCSSPASGTSLMPRSSASLRR